MTHTDSQASDAAGLALATYLEPLVRGRRVLLIDSPDSDLLPHLASLADAVQAAPGEELTIVGSHADAELELAFDDEPFDLVWVADVNDLPDPRARAIDAFRNALARDGALVLCAGADSRPRRRRSRGGRPTDALRKLASQAFEEVLTLTQSAFHGFTIDAPDAPDGGTALDQSLVERRSVAPLWHVAVAADRLPALESRLVVQVPAAEPEAAVDEERVQELERRLAELATENETLRADAVELDDALERALVRVERSEKASLAAERDVEELTRRRRKDREELERARDRVRSLERDLDRARAQAADTEELEALRDEARELEGRLVEVGAKVVDLEAEIERRGEIARDLMVDLERAREEVAAAPAPEPAPTDEQVLVAAELPGSSLLGRDSERVRAMGAELLTYRQHAVERDELRAQLEKAHAEVRVERARMLGMQMRLEEAERALERIDADGATSEELTVLHEAMDSSEARVRDLSASLADAQREMQSLQGEHARAAEGGAGEELTGQLRDAQQRVADLEQALRESDDERASLREQLKQHQDGLDQTRRERDEARAGLAEARAILQQVASSPEPSSN